MEELFGSDNSENITKCQLLAENAFIEPVLHGCSYVGFIVQLYDCDFERYLKLRPAVQAFVPTIDKRIADRDYERRYIHPALSETDSTMIVRVVFDLRGRVLYTWLKAAMPSPLSTRSGPPLQSQFVAVPL